MREGSSCLGDRVKTEVIGTYQEAVNKAHEIWKNMSQKTGVTVHDSKYCIYYWHRIAATGEATDRNTNSGVVYNAKYKIKYEVGKGYIAE